MMAFANVEGKSDQQGQGKLFDLHVEFARVMRNGRACRRSQDGTSSYTELKAAILHNIDVFDFQDSLETRVKKPLDGIAPQLSKACGRTQAAELGWFGINPPRDDGRGSVLPA